MTALVEIGPTGSAPYMRVYRLIRDGIVDAGPPPGSGGGGYQLSETETLIAETILALRDLRVDYRTAKAIAECIRARPVQPGEWLVVTADGTARRHSHLCLDDLAPFDAARVVRLTSALVSPAEPPSVDGASGGIGPATSPPGCPAPGASNIEGGGA